MDQNRIHRLDRQKIQIDSSTLAGDYWVLDIGGGGEGVIGQMLGDRVIAIDPSRRELEEAPPGGLKMVMDARDLKFLDRTFRAVTSFFTLMFIGKADHAAVFREMYRVLADEGELHIWDVTIPPHDGGPRDVFACPIEVDFGGKTVQSGYGALWPDNDRDLEYYLRQAESVGFTRVATEESNHTFYLRLRKGGAQ